MCFLTVSKDRITKMWKLVEINQQTYFIYCNFNDNTQEVTFILYDLKETWSQRLSLTDVKQNVKVIYLICLMFYRLKL